MDSQFAKGEVMRSCGANTLGPIVVLVGLGLFALAHLCYASGAEFGNHVPAIAEQIAKSGKQRIAVVDFADLQGNVTELGRFLAEELSVSLAAEAKGFEVIDRTHLENLLAEHKLSTTGLIDPQTTQKLKVAGVQGLLTGTVIPLGDTVRLTLKLLDVETARISAPSDIDIPKTPAIQALIEHGVERDPESRPPTGAQPRDSSHQGVTVDKISFDLRTCRYANGRALCRLTLTSIEGDVNIGFGDTIARLGRVVDEEGTEYPIGDIKLGGSVRLNADLVAGVPMSMSFSFGAPGTTRKLPLIELYFDLHSKAQFRNISLAR